MGCNFQLEIMDPSKTCWTCFGEVHASCSYIHKNYGANDNQKECLCRYGNQLLLMPVEHAAVEFTKEYVFKECCCKQKVCKQTTGYETTEKCAVDECMRHIHPVCYNNTVGVGREPLFTANEVGTQLLFCSVVHYTAQAKLMKAEKKKIKQVPVPKKNILHDAEAT
jgi:hypothetical protein